MELYEPLEKTQNNGISPMQMKKEEKYMEV